MGVLFNSKVAIEPDYMRKKKAVENRIGHAISNAEFESKYLVTGGVLGCLIQGLRSLILF